MIMLTSERSVTKPPVGKRVQVQPETEPGEEAGRSLAVLLVHLETADPDGARAELRAWLDANSWRRESGREIASLLFLLIDRIVGLMEGQPEPPAPLVAAPDAVPGGSNAFSTSTHFSLLTAAVLRQREKIRELMRLVDSLSRRLA